MSGWRSLQDIASPEGHTCDRGFFMEAPIKMSGPVGCKIIVVDKIKGEKEMLKNLPRI